MQKVIRSRLIIPNIRNLQYFGLYSQFSASIHTYHQYLWVIYARENSFFDGFITRVSYDNLAVLRINYIYNENWVDALDWIHFVSFLTIIKRNSIVLEKLNKIGTSTCHKTKVTRDAIGLKGNLLKGKSPPKGNSPRKEISLRFPQRGTPQRYS